MLSKVCTRLRDQWRGAPLIVPLAVCALGFAPATAGAEGPVSADFNGDGFDDVAVGAHLEDVSANNAGAVNVIYGSAIRLTSTGNQVWHQDSSGIAEVAEEADNFGSSLAAGDFNGDGFDDLAVGVPHEDRGSAFDAGAVNVIYGSAGRLTATGNQIWHQDSSGIDEVAERNDYFGFSLTAGDFNGDGYDDLVAGVPGEDLGTVVDPGAVNVIYGSAGRLTATGNQGISAVDEHGGFGGSLAAGDFQADGFDDLGVGVPFRNAGSVEEAGAVFVFAGSASRLVVAGSQLWHQDSPGIAEAAEFGDGFGSSLAAGDFNGSGHDDLAVGVPHERLGIASDAGAVNVLYGAGVGLRANDNQLWHQDSSGIVDAAETPDQFGTSLSAGDFNDSGHDDLAVGAPSENLGPSVGGGGAVSVIYGSAARLTATGNQFWQQDSLGIADVAETTDFFGSSLTAGDFNGSGHEDLVAGVPGEAVGAAGGAGAVNAIYGAGVGLRANDNQLWHQDSPGIGGVGEAGDFFGTSLPN